MGRSNLVYLTSSTVFACKQCKTHVSIINDLISRQFNGQYGRACLFDQVYNIIEGPPEDRSMTTGLHTVRDISCIRCNVVLGWKYDKAYESSQRYKEGKFILEKNLLCDVEMVDNDVESLDSPITIIKGLDHSPASSVASM